jgi:uncharacterized DUF497 family protein
MLLEAVAACLTHLLKSGIFMNDNDFEWDDRKAAQNYAKHRVPFELACEVFDDPFRIEELDDRANYGEDRFNVLGAICGRVFVVTCTIRGIRIRLISARRAEPHERKRYHEEKR